MRTTLTLDPDVAQLIDDEVHRQRRPFKQVVNDALRRGLRRPESRPEGRFLVVSHKTELLPGIDPGRMNQLADELEDEVILAKLADSK